MDLSSSSILFIQAAIQPGEQQDIFHDQEGEFGLNQEIGDLSTITVETLFSENQKRLKLRALSNGADFEMPITEKFLHRPGLALAGFTDLFYHKRVQVCGRTELAYLESLSSKQRKTALQAFFNLGFPCLIITYGIAPPPELIRMAESHKILVLGSPCPTPTVIDALTVFLDDRVSPRTVIYGTLVDVYGIGILIKGKSGIGKSEVALDLVSRGHRLIADDVITVIRKTGGLLIGKGNETLGHHMEFRGVGIVDIQAVYGVRSVRRQKRIEVEVELAVWDGSEEYERTGLKEMTEDILGENLPLIRLPIYPGKNISVIVEVIALNQLLKIYGHHAAKRFDAKLRRKIKSPMRRKREPYDPDFE